MNNTKTVNKKGFVLVNLLLSVTVGLTSYYVAGFLFNKKSNSQNEIIAEQSPKSNFCSAKRVNNTHYKFIRPILYLESECESESATFFPIKNEINSVIKSYVGKGILNSASVYVRDMDNSEWVGINEKVGYSPGSLMKVPLAIAIMKMADNKQIDIDKTVTIGRDAFVSYRQTYQGKIIELGKTYTVKELLKYVLAYSDNNATNVIHHIVDKNIYAQVLDDLKIIKPTDGQETFLISPKDYTMFMRILYNGGYIGKKNSDLILEMMSQSSFVEGLAGGIDSKAVLCNKFGESSLGLMRQLHESGIVYVNNTVYIITVMTEGKDIKQLSNVIKEISKLTYHIIESNNSKVVSQLR